MTTKIQTLKKIISLWLPPVIWGLVIFSLSARSVPRAGADYWQDFVVKKIAHVIEFGILAILSYRALKGSRLTQKNAAISAILICFLFGASDELHQFFTPGRQARIRDVVIDTLGATAVLAIWERYLSQRLPKIKNWLIKSANSLLL